MNEYSKQGNKRNKSRMIIKDYSEKIGKRSGKAN